MPEQPQAVGPRLIEFGAGRVVANCVDPTFPDPDFVAALPRPICGTQDPRHAGVEEKLSDPVFGQAGCDRRTALWCEWHQLSHGPMQAQQPGKSSRSRWPILLIAACIGLLTSVAGYQFGKAAQSWVPNGLGARLDVLTGWDLLALPLLIVFVLAFHEAGHLVGGMSRGMRFLLFIAGPFGWIRGENGVHFRWFFNLGTFGGLAAALPVPGQALKPQLVRLVLGGPLASLLLAALGIAAFAWMPGRIGAYGLIVGGMSLAIFVVTALPMRHGGFMSDGMQFLQLSRNPAMVERRVRLTALMGQGMAGTRPRDYDLHLLAQAQAITGEESVYDTAVSLYSYFHAIDGGDVTAAGGWLDRIEAAFEDYPDGFRQSLAVELALYEALVRRRLEVAESWMARARGGVVDPSRRSLAEAAVASLQGRRDIALAALAAAQRKLGQSLDPGSARLSADQIDALRELANAPA